MMITSSLKVRISPYTNRKCRASASPPHHPNLKYLTVETGEATSNTTHIQI